MTTRVGLDDKPQSLDGHHQAAVHWFDCSQTVEKAPSRISLGHRTEIQMHAGNLAEAYEL